jgi:PASTA domain
MPKRNEMGRLGTFVPRLVALTAVWLLATTALTYAAAQRIGTVPPATATTAATTTAAPAVKVVPDVRRQPFVFAKGTLGDDGFSWRVEGSVRGFASNTVVSQSPAAGSRLIDTGAPLIVLRLARGGKESGLPEDVSTTAATATKLVDLATAASKRVARARVVASAVAPAAKVAVAKKKVAVAKKTVAAPTKKKQVAAARPSHRRPRWPQNRPPAFTVAGAGREPLDEMPLAVRAKLLLDWLQTGPKPTDPNVKRWLYQHAWIVAGARMGWWQGDEALQTLVAADNRVWALWGIGARSRSIARQTLAEVEVQSK